MSSLKIFNLGFRRHGCFLLSANASANRVAGLAAGRAASSLATPLPHLTTSTSNDPLPYTPCIRLALDWERSVVAGCCGFRAKTSGIGARLVAQARAALGAEVRQRVSVIPQDTKRSVLSQWPIRVIFGNCLLRIESQHKHIQSRNAAQARIDGAATPSSKPTSDNRID